MPNIVPKKGSLNAFSSWLYEKGNDAVHGTANEGLTISDIEKANVSRKKTGTHVMRGDNIGFKSDSWSDARFAQLQFTGTNPTTITLASVEWIKNFQSAATKQDRKNKSHHIAGANPKMLDVQDCRYIRAAVNAEDTEELVSKDPDTPDRFACAPVALFQLHPDGKLHPIAMVIDYKGNMDNSVVIINKRLQPNDPFYAEPSESEKNDGPWRYAKTCVQSSDWIRHEMAIHLLNTHLVEEVIIVAANRSFPFDNAVFRLLEPH